MMAHPVCSVIVPSFCSSRTIRACLTALMNQDISLPYEIIVVDSSPDDTPALVRHNFPLVQLVHLSQQTDPALARNIGARKAQGEVLAFIDADCVAAPDWLRCLCETLEQGYDAAGGVILNDNGETLVSWAGYMCEFREFLPGGASRSVDNLTLGNAAYWRSAFWAAGGFPAGCFPQEDQVFHHTFRRQGRRIRLDPRIRVSHTHRVERRAFLDHQRAIGQANARVMLSLGLPGAGLARRPWLAHLAMPALVLFRFMRTVHACWRVERALLLRRPALAWLCWLGMCWWGQGFLQVVGTRSLTFESSYVYASR
jgi:glycosyltransferase involved in cell wall biosynthesis